MDGAFTHQEEREGTQQPRQCYQLKHSAPKVKKLSSFDNSSTFAVFGFWVKKSLKKFHCGVGFSSGFGSKRLVRHVMVVNNNSVFCSTPELVEEEEERATMEGLNVEKIEGNGELKSDEFCGDESRVETFGDLIEDKGRDSSSSFDFLTSETTGREEQSRSSSEESASSPSLGWPVHKTETQDCCNGDGNSPDGNEEKQHVKDRKLEKQSSKLSEVEMMKERFAKLLLGEDMSGCGNGVSTACAISNAITNLCATLFGQLWRLEPLPNVKKAMWRREMEWLIGVSDHIVELIPSWQTFPDGSKLEVMSCRPRSDLYINLPALRKLDNMLLEIMDSFENSEFWYVDQGILAPETDGSTSFRRALQRQEEKWWLPVPRVPLGGLHENTRKPLQHKRDCTNQILKAAMAINSITLADMEVPESYFESLPKNGRASLGDLIYRYISSDQFSPECLLECLDLSSEHQAIEIANRVESAIYVWRRRTNPKPPNGTTRSSSKSSWGLVKEFVADTEKRELLADRAESLLLCLKQWFPGLPQTTLDMSKIQYNKDVGKSVLESYSRVLESLASNIVARIDDLLYVDDLTKHSDAFSPMSKVGAMPYKSVSIPYPVPVPSSPYKSAFSTPTFSPVLINVGKADISPFRTSSKIPQRGLGVKKALTDYLSIDSKGKDSSHSISGSDSTVSTIGEASPSENGSKSSECTENTLRSPVEEEQVVDEGLLRMAL